MADGAGWRIATFVLGGTTLVLAGVLATELVGPPADFSPAASPAPGAVTDEPTSPPRRSRVAVAEPDAAEPDVPTATTDPAPEEEEAPRRATVADSQRAELRARLAALPVDEVCLLLVRDGTHYVDDVLARLATDADRERAADILEEWIGRWRAGALARVEFRVDRGAMDVYAALRGERASPLLSELVFQRGNWNLAGSVVRSGDRAALERLDALQRGSAGRLLCSPFDVARAGPEGAALVRAWATDAGVSTELREGAQIGLWHCGDDDDREQLLAGAAPEVVIRGFYTVHAATSPWRERVQAYRADRIEDADPWLRRLAALHTLRGHHVTPAAYVSRALERAHADADLPCPPGRDEALWGRMDAEIRELVMELEGPRSRDRRIRAALGLPPPPGPEGATPPR